MTATILGAIRALHKWAGSSWLVLLGLAVTAAALYVDARRARADRDAWAAWSREICALAGTSPDPVTVERRDAAGRVRRVAMPRGALCRDAVAALAQFRTDAQAQAAATLAQAAADREAKATTDRAAQARQSAARTAATRQMEDQNARITGDQVGGEWFAALNRLGGLRD